MIPGIVAGAAVAGGGGDPHFSSVSLLLPCNGVDGSTTFIDRSPVGHTVTANGDAQISTAQSMFGGSSAVFDGAGDFLSIPSHSSLQLNAGPFTVEGYFRVSSLSGQIRAICSHRNSNSAGWVLWVRDDGVLNFAFGNSDAVTVSWVDLRAPSPVSLDVWHHGAATYDGTTCRLFLDRSQVASTTSFVGARGVSSQPAYVGRDRFGNVSRDFIGHIGPVRVTKGIARDIANEPDVPFPDF